MVERCGERTRTGSQCRWPMDECPVRVHQRARDRRAERRYLQANPIPECNEACADSGMPVEQCNCVCGGTNHGRHAPSDEFVERLETQSGSPKRRKQPGKRKRSTGKSVLDAINGR